MAASASVLRLRGTDLPLWRVEAGRRRASDADDSLPKGERVFTTDENGLLTAPLLLSDSDLAGFELKDGQTLTFEARMIGATRELLKDSLTLPVRASPWQVRVKPSSDNLVPGLSFGVSVDVVDDKGVSVNDVKVAIELADATDAEANALSALIDDATGELRLFANRNTAQKCTATSDGGRSLQCTKLLIKATKKGLLRATATAPDGSLAESALPLGKTADEWTASPVAALPVPVLIADKQQYLSGDVPTISFMNPFAGDSRLLVRWGNAFATRHAQFAFKNEGETTFSLPALGAECRTGCTLVVALLAGRDATRALAGAPISNLFDIKGAQSHAAQIQIEVSDKSLALGEVRVSSDAPDNVTAPRKRVEFTVDVAGNDGKPVDHRRGAFVRRRPQGARLGAARRAARRRRVPRRNCRRTSQSTSRRRRSRRLSCTSARWCARCVAPHSRRGARFRLERRTPMLTDDQRWSAAGRARSPTLSGGGMPATATPYQPAGNSTGFTAPFTTTAAFLPQTDLPLGGDRTGRKFRRGGPLQRSRRQQCGAGDRTRRPRRPSSAPSRCGRR
jgi:hypothetical protein